MKKYKIKMRFYCNAGMTEEVVNVEIYNKENEDKEIQEAFHKWLGNNEEDRRAHV